MCGIAGIVTLQAGGAATAAAASKMAARLNHRGPDGSGTFSCVSKRAAFAFRRLAIIDLQTGDQPMSDAGGSHAIVYNGEIYNYKELREELAPRHLFRTHSDTEVLLQGLIEQGDAYLSRLRGMFALALWSRESGTLLLARDRFGKKPLFYCESEGRLFFASELKALRAVLPALEIDRTALAQYLSLGYVPGSRTIYRGICRLPPGTVLEYSARGLELRRYWQLPFPAVPPVSTDDEWVRRIESRLEECVRMRLIADVPVGAFLSGGLDSSTVVALAMRHASRPFHTFTVRVEGGDAADADAALALSKHFGSEHHEIGMACPSPEDALATMAHFDEPFADPSLFPTTAVSALAHQFVKVALSGDGGDEMFGGYGVYASFARCDGLGRLPLLPSAARALAAVLPEGAPGRAGLHQLAAADRAHGYLAMVEHFSEHTVTLLAGKNPKAREELETLFRPPFMADPVARAQWLDAARSYLPGDILPKVDLASMSRSLEVRAPLLDHLLAEELALLPEHLRMRAGRGKILLRAIAGKLLPAEILSRPKLGFSVPLASWLRAPLRPLVQQLLASPSASLGALLNPARLRAFSAPPHTERAARLQFNLLSLAAWVSCHG